MFFFGGFRDGASWAYAAASPSDESIWYLELSPCPAFQDYHISSRGSRTKPSFATVTGRGDNPSYIISSHPEASCLKLPGHDGAQTHISSRWLNPAFEKKAPKKMGSSFPITWGWTEQQPLKPPPVVIAKKQGGFSHCSPEATQLPKSLRQLPGAIKTSWSSRRLDFFSKACAGFKNCYISLWPQHASAIFLVSIICG